jgi:hypothetical protein
MGTYPTQDISIRNEIRLAAAAQLRTITTTNGYRLDLWDATEGVETELTHWTMWPESKHPQLFVIAGDEQLAWQTNQEYESELELVIWGYVFDRAAAQDELDKLIRDTITAITVHPWLSRWVKTLRVDSLTTDEGQIHTTTAGRGRALFRLSVAITYDFFRNDP